MPVYLLHALGLMALARIRLRSVTPAVLDEMNRRSGQAGLRKGPWQQNDRRLVDLVARAIPWLGKRVPWRSDCLVQAMAAQSWLKAHGIPSRIELGVARSAANGFESHAWLLSGERIVTGGAVDRYTQLPIAAPEEPYNRTGQE